MSSKTPVKCPECKHEFVPVKEKKPRELSEYNLFFVELMKTEEVKKLEHKDRMKYIGALWRKKKGLPPKLEKAEKDSGSVAKVLPTDQELAKLKKEVALAKRKADLAAAKAAAAQKKQKTSA